MTGATILCIVSVLCCVLLGVKFDKQVVYFFMLDSNIFRTV